MPRRPARSAVTCFSGSHRLSEKLPVSLPSFILPTPQAAKAMIEQGVRLYNVQDKQAFLGSEAMTMAMQMMQQQQMAQMMGATGGPGGTPPPAGAGNPSPPSPPMGAPPA